MMTIIESESTIKMVKVIYILNFIGIIFPVALILALIFAYVFQDDAKDYLRSHFRYQIRGFWINLLYFVIAGLLCLVVVGFVLLVIATLWWIIRNAKGLKAAMNKREIANPATWLF